MNPHSTRKASDEEILMLNSMGLSVTGIAAEYDMHPTSVSARLKRLKVPAANPRKAFMDSVLKSLSEPELYWLSNKVSPEYTISAFIRDLIIDKYKKEMSTNEPDPESHD